MICKKVTSFLPGSYLSLFDKVSIRNLIDAWDKLQDDEVICRKYNDYIFYKVTHIDLYDKFEVTDDHGYTTTHSTKGSEMVNYEFVVIKKSDYESGWHGN